MFITLEGPDGSGKTLQIHLLEEFLTAKGYKVFCGREPGDTFIGEQIRQVLMDHQNKNMHPRTETLLFCAARAQLVQEVLKPHLERGDIVLLDRYADSTMAYQGYGHQFDLDLIRSLLHFATGGLRPDLTFLLDVDPQTGLERRQKGGGEWNRMDAYVLQYHQRVRQGYLEMAQADSQRWKIVDASRQPDVVQSDLQEILLSYLSNLS
jgi:thymidylate kinase